VDRLNAWTAWSENEWRFSVKHGTLALEELKARGVEITPDDLRCLMHLVSLM
jgi:hypothetical protein